MPRLSQTLREDGFTWYEHLWVGWPLVLAIAGGLLGGACGGAAWALNRRVFKKIHEPVMRYLLTAMISVTAVVCYSLLAATVMAAIGGGRHGLVRETTAQEAHGFKALPVPDGMSTRGIVIFAPANCPSDAAQRAEALARHLASRGIAFQRSSAAQFGDLASREEAERVMAVMNGPIPVVYVNGRAKANPSPEEVEAEYRRVQQG